MLMTMMVCFAGGVMVGVGLMCLMFIARDEPPVLTRCTGNCNQGRACTCWQVRQQFDDESA